MFLFTERSLDPEPLAQGHHPDEKLSSRDCIHSMNELKTLPTMTVT